jgi:hypothetical protein
MRWRVYVEKTEVDVPDDLSAQFTYAIDDIRDFASRNTSFSKTIVLPGTHRNNKAFGHIFEVGSGNFVNDSQPNIGYNFNAARAASCIATMDGILIFKGVLRLMEIVIDGGKIEYETALFGELGGLVAAIGDKKLEELDFSAYDHTFDISTVGASWSSALGSGYYYPLIDYGYTADGITFPVETFRPAFYAKEYLDKIFEAAGYTYESTFINSDYFKSLIIPYNGLFPSLEVSTIVHGTRTSTYSAGIGGAMLQFTSLIGTQYMDASNSNSRFTWRRAEKVTAKATFTANFTATSVGSFWLDFLKNGVVIADDFHGTISGTTSITAVIDMDFGDYFEIRVRAGVGATVAVTNSVFKIEGQPTLLIPITHGDSLQANQMIPKNILQKDFLASLVKMFNLYLDEDNVIEKHLLIEPFIQYYDTSTQVNWDKKLDRDQPIRLTPMGEMNARSYEYKYKDDSDYYNDLYKKKYGVSYGSFIYDSGFEFIKDKQTVEIIFSPTPLVGFTGTDRVIPSIKKKTETTQERTASNIRILFRSAAPIPCAQYKLTYWTSGAFATNNVTEYGYAGHLDDPDAPTQDLNWGVPNEFYFTIVTGYLTANLFNVFWSFYLSEITDKDSKVMAAFFKLSPVDIYNLDFSKLIYIAGMLWRLSSVQDYSTNQPDLTKCELLKVIDIE